MADRPLTILEITHAGHQAGSTFMIHSLCTTLAQRGHRVLVGCRPNSVLADLATGAGLPIVPLDFRRLGPLAGALERVFAREKVDLVNSHDTRDRRALTWLRWRRRLLQPFVVTRHTMPLTSPVELIAIGLSADRTIAVSHAVGRGLRRRLYPGARLRVVPNGIDLARVDALPSPETMARAATALGDVAGRPVIVVLARRKDQHILLEALAALERPVVVACVGIEPDAQLRAVEVRLPPRHRVVYVPFTDQPLAFYRLGTIAALPSRIEGLSLALSRAWRSASHSWRRGREGTPTSSRRAKRDCSSRRSTRARGPRHSSSYSAIRRSPRGSGARAVRSCDGTTHWSAWSSARRLCIMKRWSAVG